jgi:hypothetical protein
MKAKVFIIFNRDKIFIYTTMALRDWVRNDGYIDSYPGPLPPLSQEERDKEVIMLVRDIQFQDIHSGGYNRFPTLYDVALANKGKNYIPVTDNTKLIQDPPNPNAFRNKNY